MAQSASPGSTSIGVFVSSGSTRVQPTPVLTLTCWSLLALRASALPLKLFNSSSGFRLHNREELSPDASLVGLDRCKYQATAWLEPPMR